MLTSNEYEELVKKFLDEFIKKPGAMSFFSKKMGVSHSCLYNFVNVVNIDDQQVIDAIQSYLKLNNKKEFFSGFKEDDDIYIPPTSYDSLIVNNKVAENWIVDIRKELDKLWKKGRKEVYCRMFLLNKKVQVLLSEKRGIKVVNSVLSKFKGQYDINVDSAPFDVKLM